MAEGVAAVGLAGAIVQLVEFSAKIIKRLKEFDSATDKIPESFRVIKIQLPLITDTLSRIQAQTQAESTGAATSNAYSAVIDNSIEEVERLTKLLDKALPTRALSTFETRRKALQSLVCDKKVQKCIDKILGNIQILNLYQSTNCYQTIDHLRQGPLQSCSVSSKIASNFSFGLNIGDAPQIEQEAFIGRELELKQLDDWLGPLKSPFTQKIVAIAGMGGMGKTQLSLAFAKHYRHGYSSVFWLNAKDQATLKQSFVSLSEIILGRLPGSNICDAPNQDQVIHEVRQWFSQHENDQWLLLFDNYDDPNLPGVSSITGYDIRRYFPFKDQGSILITTRSRRLSFARELVLHKLDDTEQSMAILSHRSRRNMKDGMLLSALYTLT